MEYKLILLGSCLVILFSEILTVNHYYCPEVVRIEIAGESTISCAENDKQIEEAYWYKGSASHTSPILQLKDGNFGGSGLGNGHFEMAEDGAMIIKNASILHEAVYTFYAFFGDKTSKKKVVTVHIISTPVPPCPYVNGCSSCGACNLTANDNGNLNCTLMEIRPKMTINWTIESSKGVNFTSHLATVENDVTTGIWNVLEELSYTAFSCEGEATIHCVAQDDYGLLDYSSSTVNLKIDVCKDDDDNKVLFVMMISLVFSISIVVPASVWVCYRTKKRGSQAKHKSRYKTEQLATLDEIDDDRQKAKVLAKYLKEAYQRRCWLEPFPWGKAIPTALAYAECQLKVQYEDECSIISSKELFTDESLKHHNRVMIVGDAGCGKTSITKALIQNWIDEKENHSILLYISAEEMTENLDIASLLLKILATKRDVTINKIQSVLTVSNLWLLIDGLDKLPVDLHKEVMEGGVSFGEYTVSQLTVKELLKGKAPMNTQVWATSRRIKNITSLFSSQYIEIAIEEFSEKQLKSYVRITCAFYSNLNSQRDSISKLKGTPVDSKLSTEIQYEINDYLLCENDSNMSNTGKPVQINKHSAATNTTKEVMKNTFELNKKGKTMAASVLDFVEKNQVYNFCSTLSLLVLIVHILAAQYTSAIDLPYTTIKNMGHLISIVIQGLEKRFLQITTSNSLDMNFLENTLEQLAYKTMFEDSKVVVQRDSCLMDLGQVMTTATEIGFLQPLKGASSDMEKCKDSPSTRTVKFCHKFIEEFFAARYIVNHLDDTTRKASINLLKQNQQLGVLAFLSFLQNSSDVTE